jgi:hypothetical protein
MTAPPWISTPAYAGYGGRCGGRLTHSSYTTTRDATNSDASRTRIFYAPKRGHEKASNPFGLLA